MNIILSTSPSLHQKESNGQEHCFIAVQDRTTLNFVESVPKDGPFTSVHGFWRIRDLSASSSTKNSRTGWVLSKWQHYGSVLCAAFPEKHCYCSLVSTTIIEQIFVLTLLSGTNLHHQETKKLPYAKPYTISYLPTSEVSLVPRAEQGLWAGLLLLLIGNKMETTQTFSLMSLL